MVEKVKNIINFILENNLSGYANFEIDCTGSPNKLRSELAKLKIEGVKNNQGFTFLIEKSRFILNVNFINE